MPRFIQKDHPVLGLTEIETGQLLIDRSRDMEIIFTAFGDGEGDVSVVDRLRPLESSGATEDHKKKNQTGQYGGANLRSEHPADNMAEKSRSVKIFETIDRYQMAE
jgi:hypothetical protein